MAKRGRPAKDKDGLQPITVLVPPELKQALTEAADKEMRPFSEVVRRRLAQASSGDVAIIDKSLTPWAQTLGRLMALLADDLARGSQSADEAMAAMRAGAAALLDGFMGAYSKTLGEAEVNAVLEDAREGAGYTAQALASRILKAHEERERAGDDWAKRMAEAADRETERLDPSTTRIPREELMAMQEALYLSPAFLAKVRAKRAEKKGKGAK